MIKRLEGLIYKAEKMKRDACNLAKQYLSGRHDYLQVFEEHNGGDSFLVVQGTRAKCNCLKWSKGKCSLTLREGTLQGFIRLWNRLGR